MFVDKSEIPVNKLPQILANTVTELTAKDLEGVTSLRYEAFKGLSNLVSVELPEGVEELISSQFAECRKLKTIILPNSLKNLSRLAFKGTLLVNMNLPSVYIGKWLVYVSHYTTEINSSNIKSDTVGIAGRAFYESISTSLKKVELPSTILYLSNEAFYNCKKLTDVILPKTLTIINDGLFNDCTSLANITIPENVTTIGESAFFYCTSLANITIPENVTTIGGYAFSHCTSLTNITIPENVTTIRKGTFSSCDSLAKVIIPSSVTFIDYNAFYRSSSSGEPLTLIMLGTNPPKLNGFKNVFGNATFNKVIVPKGSLEAYKTATNWSNLADYMEEATE